VVIELPGDASHIGSILLFLGFWDMLVSVIGIVITNSSKRDD